MAGFVCFEGKAALLMPKAALLMPKAALLMPKADLTVCIVATVH